MNVGTVPLQLYTFVAYPTEYMDCKIAPLDHTPVIQFKLLPASNFRDGWQASSSLDYSSTVLLARINCSASADLGLMEQGNGLGCLSASVSTLHLKQM